MAGFAAVCSESSWPWAEPEDHGFDSFVLVDRAAQNAIGNFLEPIFKMISAMASSIFSYSFFDALGFHVQFLRLDEIGGE